MQPLTPRLLARLIGGMTGLVGLTGLVLACLGPDSARAATETGFMAVEVDTGRIVAASRPDTPFIPASVSKLPTALAVLQRLGPGHRYTTRLLRSGMIQDGVLRGDLYLVGGGDPMLDHPALQAMAQALSDAGVKRVEGRFVYDGSALPHIPILNDRQPPDASYNPGLDGLSLDHNRFLVTWANGRPVGAQIPLDPLPVDSLPEPETPTWLPVRTPAAFAARTFVWAASQVGVTLPRPVSGHAPAGAHPLVSHQSPALADALRAILYYSNNVATEIVALTATGAASPHDAEATLLADLRRRLPDLDSRGLVLPNASGLNDEARMTPRQCVRFALEAARSPQRDDLLPPLLLEPFAKPDDRLPSPSPLRAKTGTLAYARALSGTVETVTGRKVAFCVMTDDKTERAAYAALPFKDRAVERPTYRAWRKAALETEQRLIAGWRERSTP